MGRDGAFPGIFNRQVLDLFSGKIYKTDLDIDEIEAIFFELEWQKDKIKYYNKHKAIGEVAATTKHNKYNLGWLKYFIGLLYITNLNFINRLVSTILVTIKPIKN